jgi:hypothetical protein
MKTEYIKVFFAGQKTELDAVYGEWGGGWILLPAGKTGKEILSSSKATKAEIEECEKRGAT